MPPRKSGPAPAERLRVSPAFALAFSQDGRPYIAKEVEPYVQYWLDERYRVLHSLFAARRGATAAEAMEGYFRLTRAARTDAERKRLVKAIDDMRSARVLLGSRDDVSRYDAKMADDYLAHRPFPRELVEFIVKTAPVRAPTRVLDLAGGPGDLAIQLAHTSRDVTLMELSRGFVNAARARAKRLGIPLTALHESANRFMYMDDEYDIVTVSQALHWLDDVMICRGLVRSLVPDGSFFVIHSTMDLPDSHPLAVVFGDESILGRKDPRPFKAQAASLCTRLALLLDALDAPDVQRHDPTQRWRTSGAEPIGRIVPAGVSFFRQRRPFDMGYARAFLTSSHIRQAGHDPQEVWREIELRAGAALPEQLMGAFDWAVLHFRRGGERYDLGAIEREPVNGIAWEPRAENAPGRAARRRK
jgi:2-polyprenyl-3-methyl-5-hydroxy-6-metoxy-1,4-benzoquinol methylase